MIIDTPEGQTETIEKTFNDYLMVISRQIPPENLLNSRKEIEALERKLEIAELELRLERRHLTKAIESLEMQMSQFYGLFGKLIENLPHNPLYMNQFTNNNPNANIANLVNQNQDTAKVISSNFSQNQGTNTAELLELIANLRQTASQFPSELQAGVMVDLEDVETEIQKPENQRNLPKLQMRLIALFTAASLMGGAIANITDFTNNITDLATKAGIELKLPATFP
jgi:internalin A